MLLWSTCEKEKHLREFKYQQLLWLLYLERREEQMHCRNLFMQVAGEIAHRVFEAVGDPQSQNGEEESHETLRASWLQDILREWIETFKVYASIEIRKI